MCGAREKTTPLLANFPPKFVGKKDAQLVEVRLGLCSSPCPLRVGQSRRISEFTGASGLHSRAIPAIINRHRGRAAANHECYRPQTGQRAACHFTTRSSWDAGRGRAGRRADCVCVCVCVPSLANSLRKLFLAEQHGCTAAESGARQAPCCSNSRNSNRRSSSSSSSSGGNQKRWIRRQRSPTAYN